MTTLDLTTENKKNVGFVNLTNTKRLQWNRYRRYSY